MEVLYGEFTWGIITIYIVFLNVEHYILYLQCPDGQTPAHVGNGVYQCVCKYDIIYFCKCKWIIKYALTCNGSTEKQNYFCLHFKATHFNVKDTILFFTFCNNFWFKNIFYGTQFIMYVLTKICYLVSSFNVNTYLSAPKGRGFEPHRRHCVVVLEQDTFILA